MESKLKYFVYVLRSKKDNRLYTGFTRDLEKRIRYHNNGLNASIKYRRPFVLVYQEGFFSEKEARQRERFLKTGSGRDYLRTFVK